MQQKVLSTIEEIKIYSDPYRIQILNMFNKQGRPSTVKEIADKLGEVPAKVHYHVKKLEKIGLLTIVSTREINGIIAKYYEPFQGEIHLRHENEDHSPLKQVFLSETLKLFNGMYEQSRQMFMKQAEHGENMFGQISDMTLYASREEVEKLYKDIIKMCEPYKKRNEQKEDQEVFQLFTTMSKHVDEPTESKKSKVPQDQPGDQSSKPNDDAKEK
ncbi:winged helix-turn-helix domain-containing protein [Paenibacillus illinoisensis]|uniref:ArsR/SmtB family transcription factor n=1 Tax=Paenibacillus illinoisensis TaxID=59845 RepID=UPI003D28DC58